MKKHNIIATFLTTLTLLLTLNSTASAYTSARINLILQNYSSYFPMIVGGMLVIEVIMIMLLTDVKRIVNVSFAVLVANVASFVLPRLGIGLLRHEVFFKGMITQGLISSNIIAGVAYLVVSLIIELPILYFMLRVFTPKKVRLMVVAAAANVVTTVAFTVVEFQLHKFITQ
ncbi:MAG: hypothetical protein IJT79_04355 [Ruminococcus sp.]|nr:hypothetical protein [Ruminococcus sp.]